MIDLALVLVIACLLSFIGFQDYNNRKERAKMLNAIVAKTPEQLRDLDFVDKVEVKAEKPLPAQDLVPSDQLSDEEFAEAVGAIHG